MLFIARAFHQHGDAQRLELLLRLGAVEDHRVLNGKLGALAQQQLVIRGGVFSRVEDALPVHAPPHFRERPVVPLRARQAHRVQRVQARERVHHRRGGDIERLQRRVQHGHAGLRLRLRAFGHEEEAVFPGDRHQRAALRVKRDRELIGVAQLHRGGLRPARRFRLRLRAAAERQRREQQQKKPFFHGAAVIAAELKHSVYSISCGWLMAVVSAITPSARSNAATGIQKTELPSVFTGR